MASMGKQKGTGIISFTTHVVSYTVNEYLIAIEEKDQVEGEVFERKISSSFFQSSLFF